MHIKKYAFTLFATFASMTGLAAGDISLQEAETFSENTQFHRCWNNSQNLDWIGTDKGCVVPSSRDEDGLNPDYRNAMDGTHSHVGDMIFDNANFQTRKEIVIYKDDHIPFHVTHLSRNPLIPSSLGKEFFSSYDIRIELVQGGNGPELHLFDPELGQTAVLKKYGNGGDPYFEDAAKFYKAELFCANAIKTGLPAAALTVELTTRSGNVLSFEVIDLDVSKRDARFVKYTSKEGESIDINYQTFTPAEIAISPELQLVMSNVTDGTRSVSFTYKDDGNGTLVTEQGYYVIEKVTLPNTNEVDFTYGVEGLSSIDLPTNETKTFATTIETNGQVRMDFDNQSVWYKNAIDTEIILQNPQVISGASKLPLYSTVDGKVEYLISAQTNPNQGRPMDKRMVFANGGLKRYTRQFWHNVYSDFTLADPTLAFDGFSNLEIAYKVKADDSDTWTPGSITFSDGTTATYEYYADGNLKRKTFSDSTTEYYEYDTFNHTTLFVDRNGHASRKTYNASGKRLTSEKGLEMIAGVATAVSGEYAIKTNTYDVNGRLQYEGDYNGNQLEYIYNVAGDLVEVREPTDTGTGDQLYQSYTYTASGRVDTITNVDSEVTTLVYDELDDLVTTPVVEPSEVGITRNDAGMITSIDHGTVLGVSKIELFTYENSKLFSHDDGYNFKTFYVYRDSDSQLVRKVVSRINGFDAVDSTAVLALSAHDDYTIFDYELDAVGNITAIIRNESMRHEKTYDSIGRPSEIKRYVGTINESTYVNTYNGEDLIVEENVTGSDITSYEYTRRNLKSKVTFFDGTLDEQFDDFVYWPNGSLVEGPVLVDSIDVTTVNSQIDDLEDDDALVRAAAHTALCYGYDAYDIIEGMHYREWLKAKRDAREKHVRDLDANNDDDQELEDDLIYQSLKECYDEIDDENIIDTIVAEAWLAALDDNDATVRAAAIAALKDYGTYKWISQYTYMEWLRAMRKAATSQRVKDAIDAIIKCYTEDGVIDPTELAGHIADITSNTPETANDAMDELTEYLDPWDTINGQNYYEYISQLAADELKTNGKTEKYKKLLEVMKEMIRKHFSRESYKGYGGVPLRVAIKICCCDDKSSVAERHKDKVNELIKKAIKGYGYKLTDKLCVRNYNPDQQDAKTEVPTITTIETDVLYQALKDSKRALDNCKEGECFDISVALRTSRNTKKDGCIHVAVDSEVHSTYKKSK